MSESIFLQSPDLLLQLVIRAIRSLHNLEDMLIVDFVLVVIRSLQNLEDIMIVDFVRVGVLERVKRE